MEQKPSLDLWVEEQKLGTTSLRFKVKRTLFSGRSDFQKVDVVETEALGNLLLNDGLYMASERDEFVYHDMITHPALFVHPNPKRVLVIGGGDGGTVREVVRHEEVEECVLVEIDPVVLEAAKKHLPTMSCALDHPKVEVRVEDGVEYMANAPSGSFDVILVDSTDPFGPATPLFGTPFYQDVFRVLSDNGIVVSQGESPFYDADAQCALVKTIGGVFPKIHLFNFSNLTYPGGLWSFTFASKGLCPINDFNRMRFNDSKLEFNYYNDEVHRAAFALPEFIKRQLKGLLTPIGDRNATNNH